MEVATGTLVIFDLKIKFDKESKEISFINVSAKDANSFIYVLSSKCFLKNISENIP